MRQSCCMASFFAPARMNLDCEVPQCL
jgi:hypothetical protein